MIIYDGGRSLASRLRDRNGQLTCAEEWVASNSLDTRQPLLGSDLQTLFLVDPLCSHGILR